jgi:DNA-binding PadR family transcriptional regulator
MTTRPLQEPSFLILSALADGPKHGYGVLQEVADLSEGRVVLRAGTLYTALDRLTGEGLVEVVSEEVVDGRHRRYYRISASGAVRLTVEAQRLRHNATVAVRRLKLGGLGA